MARKRHTKKQSKSLSPTTTRKWLVGVGLVLLVALGVLVYVERHHLFHPHVSIDPARFPIAGIDVSRHNGDIDFERVAACNVTFVFVKASEGVSHRDANFKRNCRAAHAAGLKVGAYHFFRKGRDGRRQAQHLIATTQGMPLDLPLVIDIEDEKNDRVDDTTTRTRLRDMVAELRDNGHRVIIYTNGDGYKKYIKGHFDDVELWLSSFKNPDSIAHIGHRFQQYSYWGEVEGVDGDVDLNIFNGSATEWQQWLDEL